MGDDESRSSVDAWMAARQMQGMSRGGRLFQLKGRLKSGGRSPEWLDRSERGRHGSMITLPLCRVALMGYRVGDIRIHTTATKEV